MPRVMCVMFVFSSLYLDGPSAFCSEAMNDKDVILKWLCSESKLRSSNAGLALDVG
jgi:hypothetical protein